MAEGVSDISLEQKLANAAGVSVQLARSVIGYCGKGTQFETLVSHCQRPDASGLGHPFKDKTIEAAVGAKFGTTVRAAIRYFTRQE